MPLDVETCWRALASRDARFDGRFFTAVRTTGIYCRPVCSARRPSRENVTFYDTAAAAERAGYRACKRCRPDAAPGSPEWVGRSAVVTRALRHVRAGAFEDGGVEGLAARVGVGARHLSRLFREELGASPGAVARTERAHLARRLAAETDLPLSEVAFAAGYGSVRRFHAEVRAHFRCAPGDLRRAGGRAAGPLCLRLAYRPPLDWDGLLAFLAARAVAGVEEVRDGAYRRTVSHAGRPGWLEVRAVAGHDALELALHLDDTRALQPLLERARHAFDLGADPAAIAGALGADPLLAGALAAAPGLRVPGAWDGFELAMRAVVGQQVSVAGARTVLGRITARLGRPVEAGGTLARLFPTPEAVAAAPDDVLGLPARRGEALRAVARAVASGALALDPSADPAEARRALASIPGIGAWTAEYVALRALGDPDAFPAGDLVLRRRAAEDTHELSTAALERRAERWRPWRGYAALALWRTPAMEGAKA